jgi:PAS domain S-box-containing protein
MKKVPKYVFSYSGMPQFNSEGDFVAGILFVSNSTVSDLKVNLTKEVLVNDAEIKQLELYQMQLKDDQELLNAIINTIPVMVTIYDKRVDSFIMNRSFIETTGWTANDIAAKGIMYLAYPDPVYRQEVLDFMQSLSPGFKDIVLRTKDGRDLETSWANVEIPDGRQVGVGINIAERKKLEKELIMARERAEKESKVQYAFIQNISHEVRTPMNSILGFTELLQKEIKKNKEAEFLKAISQNGKQLLRLIDDIIDFSQLDNNQMPLQKDRIVVSSFMKEIELQMAGMKKAYRKKQVNLIVQNPKNDETVILNSDSSRLQQVFLNLISNSLKYTDKGTIEIGYDIRRLENDVVFYVKDTGIGINPEDKDKVFKQFNRLHNTSSHEFRGTGLGLAICKHLVELLGGEIWFSSNIGQGTKFYFSHPFVELENTGNETPATTKVKKNWVTGNAVPDLRDKVILIVEDDSFSYMMMYHMMEGTRALILHADTGRKAIEIFERYKIDMVFLDIRLPELDGYQVIKHIRYVNKKIPVIAQTANAMPTDRRKITEAGFNLHITKPISSDSLYTVLNKFLT